MQEYADEQTLQMVALVRDPSTIFVYWDVDPDARSALLHEVAEENLSAARWVLRLTNQELGAVSEITIQIEARNWYVTVLAGHTYLVELGMVDGAGTYHALTQCGPLNMPPLSYSTIYDSQWIIREEDFRQLLKIAGTGLVGSSNQSTGFSMEQAASWVTVVDELPGTESARAQPESTAS